MTVYQKKRFVMDEDCRYLFEEAEPEERDPCKFCSECTVFERVVKDWCPQKVIFNEIFGSHCNNQTKGLPTENFEINLSDNEQCAPICKIIFDVPYYFCGDCKAMLNMYAKKAEYCSACGKKVAWEGGRKERAQQ